MNIHHLRTCALGVAAALITIPGYAAMQNSWHPTLYSANAQLTQSLNSNKARIGQAVTAKLTTDVKTAGATVLPDGTMLVGSVQQVQRSYSNGPSRISIVFDKARLSNGREIPIKATLLGAYPPVPEYAAGGPSSYLPIQPRTVSSNESVIQKPGTLKHITLRSSTQSSVSGVFSSMNHSVQLNRGTRLQVAIAPEGSRSSTTSGA